MKKLTLFEKINQDVYATSNEIERAANLIESMAPYIGKMALPAKFFEEFNKHSMFISWLDVKPKAYK